jgi:hypothetical protein
LAGVGTAVVLAHLLVLQMADSAMTTEPHRVAGPFVTRAVTLSVADPNAQPAHVRQAAPAPVVRPRPKPQSRPVVQPSAPSAAETWAIPELPVGAAAEPKAPEPVAQAPEPAASAASAATLPVVPAVASSPAPSPVAAVAYTVPGSVRLRYKVEALVDGQPWNVGGEFSWLQDGSTYEARLNLRTLGLDIRSYSSSGRIGMEGLSPRRFGERALRGSEQAAHFDAGKQQIIFSNNAPVQPLKSGMQDWLSAFVQLGAMFAGAPAKYPVGTQISLETAGVRGVDVSVFTVEATEKLSLPGGEAEAVKLTRPPRHRFDESVDLWLSPAHGYLPVRIRLSKTNGDFLDQRWSGTEAP